MEKLRSTRRGFLTALITLPAVLAGLWRFLTPKAAKKQVLLSVAAADLPFGAALVFRQQRIAVLRDDNGVIALSLVCTHLGCTVSVVPDGMACPCHGSRFDRNGQVLSGPAQRPLQRLTVEQNADRIVVRG